MTDFDGVEGVALVTGGSGGIGGAVCRMLAARGSDIAFTYRSNQAAADAVDTEPGGLVSRLLDVTEVGSEHGVRPGDHQVAGRAGESGQVPPVVRL